MRKFSEQSKTFKLGAVGFVLGGSLLGHYALNGNPISLVIGGLDLLVALYLLSLDRRGKF